MGVFGQRIVPRRAKTVEEFDAIELRTYVIQKNIVSPDPRIVVVELFGAPAAAGATYPISADQLDSGLGVVDSYQVVFL